MGTYVLPSFSLDYLCILTLFIATLSPPEWLCIKAGSCVRRFNVSLIVWAKSGDSVHKPQV